MQKTTEINKIEIDNEGKKFTYFIMATTIILLISGIMFDLFKNI